MENILFRCFRNSLVAVDPFVAVKKLKALIVRSGSMEIISSTNNNLTLPLQETSKVTLVAFGKASRGMILAAEAALGKRLGSGMAIVPEGGLPSQRSVAATRQVLEAIDGLANDAVILFFISGGGSALLCSPLDITLSQKLSTIQHLTSHGADIRQLNTVRSALSAVKGGKLAQRLKPGQKAVSLIISDLIDDEVEFIGSGPTVIPSRVISPLQVLRDLGVENSVEPPVKEHIEMAESEQQGLLIAAADQDQVFTQSLAHLSSHYRGDHEYRLETKGKVALIFGGETTVMLHSNPGYGGRNQEIVLAAFVHLTRYRLVAEKKSVLWGIPEFALLSAGTDGQDGPTDATGAVIAKTDVEEATEEDIKMAERHLSSSDSYTFWSKFRDGRCLLKTGLTGTNVMDVQTLLIHLS